MPRTVLLISCALFLDACEAERPGLALRMTLPPPALTVVERLVVTIAGEPDAFTMQVETTAASGATVRSDGRTVQITVPIAAFAGGTSLALLLVPTGPTPLAVSLQGAMFHKDGRAVGSAPSTAAVELRADRRTGAALAFACTDVVTCAPAAPAGSLDLAMPPPTPLVAEIAGSADGSRLGLLGTGRFRMGAPGADLVAAETRGATGVVYVFRARDWSIPGFPSLQAGRRLDGAMAQVTIVGRSGESLGDAAAIADVDGNGDDDLVVTATSAASGAGVAYVIRGSLLANDGVTIDLSDPATYMGTPRISGAAPQDLLGSAVILAHVSSTTARDLVLGAPGANGASAPGAGRIYVMPAPTGAVQAGSRGVTILGPTANVGIGLALAAGDFDADGRADLAIGNRADGLMRRGIVYVVKGSRLASGSIDLAVDRVDGQIRGAPGGLLGWSVATADVDGDRVFELAVGARDLGVAYVFVGAGALGAHDVGAREYDLARVADPASRFGSAIAVGELDGDNKSDLLIGAPGAEGPGGRTGAGAGYVVTGAWLTKSGPPGQGRTISLSTDRAALTVYGSGRGDALGERVALGRVDLSSKHDQLLFGSQGGGRQMQGVVDVVQYLPK